LTGGDISVFLGVRCVHEAIEELLGMAGCFGFVVVVVHVIFACGGGRGR
jgi:hypothetical protein